MDSIEAIPYPRDDARKSIAMTEVKEGKVYPMQRMVTWFNATCRDSRNNAHIIIFLKEDDTMSKKLNLVNQNQSNDKTAKAVVGETRLRRGKAANVGTVSAEHTEAVQLDLMLKLAKLEGEKSASRRYEKILSDTHRRDIEAMRDTAIACGESAERIIRAVGFTYTTINGGYVDEVARRDRLIVEEANSREVAHALHDSEVYKVSEAAADTTCKVSAPKSYLDTDEAKDKAAKRKAAAKKSVKPSKDDLAALEALRDSGILSDYMFKKLSAKIAESATTSVKAAKSENTTTAPRRNYNGGRRANKRKVEMTNVHNVTGKDGIVYTVGMFTRTDNGETNYAVWMEEYKAEGTTFLKSLGFKWSGYAQAFITKENPDNALLTGKKSAKSAKKSA